MRDLQDEFADGLITEHAYIIRRQELKKMAEEIRS